MIFLALILLASSLEVATQEGKALGNAGKSQALSQLENFPSQDLLSPKQQAQSFNPQYPIESEASTFLSSKAVQDNVLQLSEDEFFLKYSENILDGQMSENSEVVEAIETTIETCRITDAPYPLSVIRDLRVEVLFDPGETKEVRVCTRHTYKEKFPKKEAENQARALRRYLSSDPTIKAYQVDNPKGGGVLHRYTVQAWWEHKDDAESCKNYQTQLRVVRPPKHEEVGESWIYDDLPTIKTPNCTLIKTDCLDSSSTKVINGKEVYRQCWKERLTFLCQLPNLNECTRFNKNCDLIKKDCLQEGPYGCSLWELTFKCYSKMLKRNLPENELYGLDEISEYALNNSFSEITAKLSVFEAIKNELQETQASDARFVQVFKGQRMECGKSIADELLYDCCFSYGGLAKDLGLKNCKANEIALAQMREEGLCHYVGSYDGKFCDLWKSRDEHAFCCFGSKLARIVQENARSQLGIGWDKPKRSNCRGLSLEEISSLDFSKMDLSELYAGYEAKLPDNFQSKLQTFENSVREKVKHYE